MSQRIRKRGYKTFDTGVFYSVPSLPRKIGELYNQYPKSLRGVQLFRDLIVRTLTIVSLHFLFLRTDKDKKYQ